MPGYHPPKSKPPKKPVKKGIAAIRSAKKGK
jgi:hypothetical protein